VADLPIYQARKVLVAWLPCNLVFHANAIGQVEQGGAARLREAREGIGKIVGHTDPPEWRT
jgi:hypothetical protein